MKIYTLMKIDADKLHISTEVIASSTWKEEIMTRMKNAVEFFYFDWVEESNSWDVDDYYTPDRMEWFINDYGLNTLFKIIESEINE